MSKRDSREDKDNLMKIRAGCLNQGAATANASSEPILRAAHLIAIFKRKCLW